MLSYKRGGAMWGILCPILPYTQTQHSKKAMLGFFFYYAMSEVFDEQKTELKCYRCGEVLTPENSRPVSEEYSLTGVSHLCLNCEEEYFEKLAAVEGKSMALFHCCAAFNVPCKPAVFQNADYEKEPQLWIYYVNQLEEKSEDIDGDKVLTFFDGETDIRRLFGKNLTYADFSKYLSSDIKMPTLKQRQMWGTESIWGDMKMTAEVYDALDREYEIRKSSFAGQTLDLQQENTLRLVARNMVIYNYCMRNQQIKHAESIQKMVDGLLASEQMRKKDEKPVEGFELMSQVVALEKAGLMEEGKFLPVDKLQEVIFNKFIKGKKFDYTLDACDATIECIYNTMRKNADAFVPSELPSELKIEDTFGEFAQEESEQEKEAKKFIGYVKPIYADEGSGENE